jgi:hypothetical protein
MEDMYDVTYIRQEAFIVHMGTKDIVFVRKEKVYIAIGKIQV